jgi:nucleotide-binding universal stress UspA family protein
VDETIIADMDSSASLSAQDRAAFAAATQSPESGGQSNSSALDEAAGRDPGRINRLLLATDLSPASAVAADEAVRLAVEHGAELIILSVVDPRRLRLPGGRFLRRVDQERARVQSDAQVLVSRARASGVRATFLVWEGDPAESIIAASEAERADTIVLGSHGRGLLGRLVLGSTSARVAEDARCRVLVFPAALTVDMPRA